MYKYEIKFKKRYVGRYYNTKERLRNNRYQDIVTNKHNNITFTKFRY